MDDKNVSFVQSGSSIDLPRTTLQAKLKERDPYALHLMRQPMLMDYIPMTVPVEDCHITNFLEAQRFWLDEERQLRAAWRK